MIKLRYEGTWDCMEDLGDNRTWTIKGDCIQPDGANYEGSTVTGMKRLIDLGIVPARHAGLSWARQCFRVIRKPVVVHFK